MKNRVAIHILNPLYGALKTNKAQWDQINLDIEKLKEKSETEAQKCRPILRFQQAQFHVVIVLLTNSIIEGIANYYLASKCENDQFELLERSSTLDKLVTVPKLFLKEYKFQKNEALFCELKELLNLRTSMVHPKPRIFENGKLVHKGNLPFSLLNCAAAKPDKCLSIPVRLVEHLCSQDPEAFDLCKEFYFADEMRGKITAKVQKNNTRPNARRNF